MNIDTIFFKKIDITSCYSSKDNSDLIHGSDIF